MSLAIQHLSKVYGRQKAVDDVSFTAGRGEIVGFLGPNGAGKSTTMKIATGYLAPTSGSVQVEGEDVRTRPLRVKRVTGYLPENNPLYLDMYVHEYLRFVGRLHGLRGASLKQRVGELVEQCGLTAEQNKLIQNLSRGYRQRVGLAQSLMHAPPVLILDEPTSGLDPNQITEIRKLIREMGRDKTVLISTHIMQEVKALCTRAVIIHKGRIVADDHLDNLVNRKQEGVTLVVEFEKAVDPIMLEAIQGVLGVDRMSDTSVRLKVRDDDARSHIFRFAADHNLALVGLKKEETSLEEVFEALTTDSAGHDPRPR